MVTAVYSGVPGSAGNTVGGVGEESANAETPTAGTWRPGAVVTFTDTGDGCGTDRYIRLPPTFTNSWIRLSDGALV